MLQLKNFQDIPVSTREEARESRPHPEEPRFRLLAREERSFPCVVGTEFPVFPSHRKRSRTPQESREELQGRTTILRVPQMSPSIPGKPVFPALPRLSIRGSTHTTVARGTALWEILAGKPRGKATDPLIHAKGSVTLLLQLDSKAHLYAPTRDEDVHNFPKIHFSTGEESSGSGTDSTQGLRPRHRRERNLKRRRSPQKRREELQGRATIT